MGEEMKILMLNMWNFFNVQGGLEKVFANMANTLVHRGYEVVAMCFDQKEGTPFFKIDCKVKFINAGLGYEKRKSFAYKFQRMFILNKKKRHITDVKYIESCMADRIKPYILLEKPDVIITYNMEGTRIIKNFIKYDCPVISMLHGFPQDYFKLERYNNEYTKKALESSECIQVLMPSFIDNFKNFVQHNNVICIPNTVDFIEDKATLDNKNIICVGRVEQIHKRQHLLIEAFNIIKNNHKDWSVYFYGDIDCDKEYYDMCVNLIHKYELEKNVYFMGNTNYVYEKLLNASIFVIPSSSEGFCLALAEAMNVGLPSIGFENCPAVNELIKNSINGLLCKESIEELANALEELITDNEKRKIYGLRAKEDIKQFLPENVWNKWDKTINKVVFDFNENR